MEYGLEQFYLAYLKSRPISSPFIAHHQDIIYQHWNCCLQQEIIYSSHCIFVSMPPVCHPNLRNSKHKEQNNRNQEEPDKGRTNKISAELSLVISRTRLLQLKNTPLKKMKLKEFKCTVGILPSVYTKPSYLH